MKFNQSPIGESRSHAENEREAAEKKERIKTIVGNLESSFYPRGILNEPQSPTISDTVMDRLRALTPQEQQEAAHQLFLKIRQPYTLEHWQQSKHRTGSHIVQRRERYDLAKKTEGTEFARALNAFNAIEDALVFGAAGMVSTEQRDAILALDDSVQEKVARAIFMDKVGQGKQPKDQRDHKQFLALLASVKGTAFGDQLFHLEDQRQRAAYGGGFGIYEEAYKAPRLPKKENK